MMGWVIALALSGATLAVLVRLGRVPRATLGFVAAAIMVALAGYAAQGSPGLSGATSKAKGAPSQEDSFFMRERGNWMPVYGPTSERLITADGLQRFGMTREAVAVLRTGIDRDPGRFELWTGYANALVAQADGIVTPAARLAYERAQHLAGSNPAPRFFYAEAMAEMGDLDAARSVWLGILRKSPAAAPWRIAIAERLVTLDRLEEELGKAR